MSSRLARLLAPAGPATARLLRGDGAEVLVVPGLYSVSYLLLGPDAAVVVDVGSTADLGRIERALDAVGRSASQIRTVIPSHLHMDHVMGVDALASRLGVPVTLGRVAHEAVTAGRTLRFPGILRLLRSVPTYFMQGAPQSPRSDWALRFEFGFPWSKNRFTAALAEPLDHDTALPYVEGWRVLHTPGHADDALCFHHAQARFLIAGDTVRNFVCGEWNQLLCDVGEYRRSQRLLDGMAIETIGPGHGPVLEGKDVVRRLKTLPFFAP